jgi:CheY-like chemotaxis protein
MEFAVEFYANCIRASVPKKLIRHPINERLDFRQQRNRRLDRVKGNLHILIVEDETPFIHIAQSLVQPLLEVFPGSVVSVARRLQDALDIIATVPVPDVILLDLTLDLPMEDTIASLDKFEDAAATVLVTGHSAELVRKLLNGRPMEVIQKESLLEMRKTLIPAIERSMAAFEMRKREERQRILETLRRMYDAAPA